MAGLWFGTGWAPAPTPKVLERWDRLNVPQLGGWADQPSGNLHQFPRPPVARYPRRVDLNVYYHPTHLGAFGFGWFLALKSTIYQYANTGVGFYTEYGPAPLGSSFSVPLFALSELALSVVEDGEESLWALPCVDVRWFWGKEWRSGLALASASPGQRMARLRASINSPHAPWAGLSAGLGYSDGSTPITLLEAGAALDPDLPIDLGAVQQAAGPVGEFADGLLGLAGMRACYAPPSFPGDAAGVTGQDWWKAQEYLDAWLARPEVRDRVRDGGPPAGSVLLPPSVRVVYQGDGFANDFLLGELIDGGVGVGQRLKIRLPVVRFRDDSNQHAHPLATQAARQIASRLLAWGTRPFSLRTAGSVPGCPSALVGLWEFGVGYTVAHGLTPETLWAGADRDPIDAAVIRPVYRPPEEGGTHPYTSYRLGFNAGEDTDNHLVDGQPLMGGSWQFGERYLAVRTGEAFASLEGGGGVVPAYRFLGEANVGGSGIITNRDHQWIGGVKNFLGGVGVGGPYSYVGSSPGQYVSVPDVLITGSGPIGNGSPTGYMTQTSSGGGVAGGFGGTSSWSCHSVSCSGSGMPSFGSGSGVTNASAGVVLGPGELPYTYGPTFPLIGDVGPVSYPAASRALYQPGATITASGGWSTSSGPAGGYPASGGLQPARMFLGLGPNITMGGDQSCIYVSMIAPQNYCAAHGGGGGVAAGWKYGVSGVGGGGDVFASGICVSLGSGGGGGTLLVSGGGTGVTSFNTGEALYGNGTGPIATSAYMKFVSARPWFQDPTSGRWHAIGSVSV